MDLNVERANRVRALFNHIPRIHVLAHDWSKALPYGPFELIFVDAKPAKLGAIDLVIDACTVGGLVARGLEGQTRSCSRRLATPFKAPEHRNSHIFKA